MDSSTYQPAPHVLDRLQQVDFVAIIGPTAVGKSTLINAAIEREPSIHLVLNNTSRAPRPGERDGIDYLFKTRAEMEQRMARGEYVQVAPSVLSELYATAPEGYVTEGVAVMAVLAEAMLVFRALPFKRLRSVFIAPPDWSTWQRRLEQHGFAPDQRAKRLAEAKRSFEFALRDTETALLINDNLEHATAQLCVFLLDKSKPALTTTQPRAREIVAKLLQELEGQL